MQLTKGIVANKNVISILILSAILFLSCNSHDNKNKQLQSSVDTPYKKHNAKALLKKSIVASDVDFDTFFKKFNADRKFQLSRVHFPLKVMVNEDDKQSIKFIKKNEWTYTDFPQINGVIIQKTNETSDKTDLLLMIEDTGVQVEYRFEKKKDNGDFMG